MQWRCAAGRRASSMISRRRQLRSIHSLPSPESNETASSFAKDVGGLTTTPPLSGTRSAAGREQHRSGVTAGKLGAIAQRVGAVTALLPANCNAGPARRRTAPAGVHGASGGVHYHSCVTDVSAPLGREFLPENRSIASRRSVSAVAEVHGRSRPTAALLSDEANALPSECSTGAASPDGLSPRAPGVPACAQDASGPPCHRSRTTAAPLPGGPSSPPDACTTTPGGFSASSGVLGWTASSPARSFSPGGQVLRA